MTCDRSVLFSGSPGFLRHDIIEILLKVALNTIEGLTTDKINNPHFLKTISQFSIIGFVETWTNDSDSIFNIPGFHFVHGSNRKKHRKARRNSGGINIFVKNSLSKGVNKLPNSHNDILWIRLDHSYFKVDKDIFLATVYISPENSSQKVSDMESVYEQL